MKTIHQPRGSDPWRRPPQRDPAMLAHDLRGALQGVIGGVTALDAADVAPDVREQLDRVGEAARVLARLVRPLIGDDDDADGDGVVRIDLERFLRHVAKRWTGEARARGLRLAIETAAGAPAALEADRVMLIRAVDNLIGNATGHAGAGDVRLVLSRTPDGGAAFRLTDEGPGVPQDAIDRILGPALRPAHRPSDVAGGVHGLGLHIVRSFCDAMGADFALANRPSGGTEASIVFPAFLCGDAPVKPHAGRGADLSGVRILLAEDNPTNQIVATQMLRALNAVVTLTADGIEAMATFEAGEFDLIVIDIEMPRMTGLDVIRAIRGRTDGRQSIPIVALTAYAMREHRDRIAVAGANGLISKPITSVAALGEALRVHVARASPAPAPGTTFGPARTPAQGFEEPAAPPPEEPVADLEVFDALCSAIGTGMMAELLEKVIADLTQARRDLAAALAPLDRRPIRSASHILISVAGAIGATRLQSCARALNTAAHGDEDRGLSDGVRRCLDEIDAAVAFADSRRTPD